MSEYDKLSLRLLLENGVHLGHHKSKYNPESSMYIMGIRNKTHIINLETTLVALRKVMLFVHEIASRNGTVLFISNIPEYSTVIEKTSKKANQPYMNKQWIGGLLTNFTQIRRKLDHTTDCSHKFLLSTQGIRSMKVLPDAIVVFGVNNCKTALHEASVLNIPSIGVVDSNTNTHNITYSIPGNDDSILAINLYCQLISNAILSGSHNSIYQD